MEKTKETVTWSGQTYEMEWMDSFDEFQLKDLQQVYGFLFRDDGSLCIVRPTEKRGWRLPGGGPEPEDFGWKESIIREAKEEADIILDKGSLKIAGIIKITPISKNCERGLGYALRVVGRITAIEEQTEDISDGLINERIFIEPSKFLEYLPWGKFGEHQLNKALECMKDPK